MPPAKKAAPEGLPLATDPTQILDASDIREKTVEVPAWGCSVLVRGFTLRDNQRIINDATREDGSFDDDKHTALMIAYGIAEPVFTAEQAEALRDKSLEATNVILEAITEVNGSGEGALAKAEAQFLAE